jgi:hypothetical protein
LISNAIIDFLEYPVTNCDILYNIILAFNKNIQIENQTISLINFLNINIHNYIYNNWNNIHNINIQPISIVNHNTIIAQILHLGAAVHVLVPLIGIHMFDKNEYIRYHNAYIPLIQITDHFELPLVYDIYFDNITLPMTLKDFIPDDFNNIIQKLKNNNLLDILKSMCAIPQLSLYTLSYFNIPLILNNLFINPQPPRLPPVPAVAGAAFAAGIVPAPPPVVAAIAPAPPPGPVAVAPIQVPPVLDNLAINMRDYYITDELRLPTFYNHLLLIISRINHYQKEINNLIFIIKRSIESLKMGKTKELKNIYTEYYYNLVMYCNYLNNFINSFNNLKELYKNSEEFNNILKKLKYDRPISKFSFINLAEKLNKINSDYFIFYYLYAPENLMKLSRFNYYQIPISNISTRQLYYYNGPDELHNIFSNQDIAPHGLGLLPENVIDDIDNQFGDVRNFSFGNLNKSYNEFNKTLPINIQTSDNPIPPPPALSDLLKLKETKLPPSLYARLSDFYIWSVIEIIEKIVENISDSIIEKIKKIVEKIDIKVENNMVSVYFILCKLIHNLIKEKINIHINNAINEYYKEYINNNQLSIDIDVLLSGNKELSVNLEKHLIDANVLHDLINIYPIINTDKKEVFINYSNDFTNLNKIKTNYGVKINEKIIDMLLDNNVNPYLTNSDDMPSIYQLIKTYNYEIINKLKDKGIIDFLKFKPNPINYMKTENLNNLDKILNNYKIDDPMNKILLNINSFLYDNIKSLIKSNDMYCDAIPLYLEESFHLCTYLMLQYLSLFKLPDIKNIISDFNNVYLIDYLNKLNVNKNDFILKQIFNTYKENAQPNAFNINRTNLTKVNDFELLQTLHNIENIQIVHAWKLLFDEKINEDLALIHLLIKQKELISSFNMTSKGELSDILKIMKYISELAEDYFKKEKYTDDNKILLYIENILLYITKLFIGNSIELMIRRILLIHFTNTLEANKFDEAIKNINFILTNNLSQQSMIDKLYGDICPRLVKSLIITNKNDVLNEELVKDILINYFEQLRHSPIELPDIVMNMFIKDVVNYFDIFISKTILLWYVNCENILKFFINNHRCLEILYTIS